MAVVTSASAVAAVGRQRKICVSLESRLLMHLKYEYKKIESVSFSNNYIYYPSTYLNLSGFVINIIITNQFQFNWILRCKKLQQDFAIVIIFVFNIQYSHPHAAYSLHFFISVNIFLARQTKHLKLKLFTCYVWIFIFQSFYHLLTCVITYYYYLWCCNNLFCKFVWIDENYWRYLSNLYSTAFFLGWPCHEHETA